MPTKEELDATPPEEPKKYRLNVEKLEVVFVPDVTPESEADRVLRFTVQCSKGENFHLAIPEGAGKVPALTPDIRPFTLGIGQTKLDLPNVVDPTQYKAAKVYQAGLRIAWSDNPTLLAEYKLILEGGVTKVQFGAAPLAGLAVIVDYIY